MARTESPMKEIELICMHSTIITSALLYLFFANYAGQEIMDYNNDVFFTA